MALDQTTESIAHFVGLFQITLEKMVLRDQYNEFRAAIKAAEELAALEADPFKINSGYRLKDYDPDLNYSAPADANPADAAPQTGDVYLPPWTTFNKALAGPAVPAKSENAPAAEIIINYTLPMPSSVVVVTVQLANLSDNDTFGVNASEMFIPVEVFDAIVSQLVAIAKVLEGFDIPAIPESGDGWMPFAAEVRENVEQAVEAEPDASLGETVTVLSGDDTQGITINGETAEEITDFQDLLPSYLQEDEDAELDVLVLVGDDIDTQDGETSTGNDVDADVALMADDLPKNLVENNDTSHDFAADFEDDEPSPFKVDDGHEILAGANVQVNEVQISSSWLDAKVIAVKGDVIKLDAISQVNVFSAVDFVNGQLEEATSTAINAAKIIQTSSEADPVEDKDEDKDEDEATETTQEAQASDDVVVVDVAEALADDVEHDNSEPDLPDPEIEEPAYAGLPTNAVVVSIDADVTQINWTVQNSFVTDHDSADVTISAAATYIGLGDNSVTNQVLLTESGFNYDLIFVGGDLIDLSLVSQTNVMLDGGTVQADLGEAVEVSSGDNLQYNLVELNTVGIDTEAELAESFSENLETLAEGGEEVSGDVQNDQLFDGVEMLRVLYIEGDYISINVAEQTNVLGDVDQINVAQAAADAAEQLEGLAETIVANTQAQISVVTGSNAQANITAINEFGVDSTVMAGGEFYSDALIHQAELIDTDAIPTGVELAALTNEAVAFLADDMMSNMPSANDIIANTMIEIYDTAGQSDVMQTLTT